MSLGQQIAMDSLSYKSTDDVYFYGFIDFHFALVPINPQARCALGNVVVFYLASRQQWLRKMLVSALSVVWTPWPTFLAR